MLIKYEDLVNDTEKTFIKILKFIAHLGKVKFTLDKEKFNNTLKTTSFDKMKKLEDKETFAEAKCKGLLLELNNLMSRDTVKALNISAGEVLVELQKHFFFLNCKSLILILDLRPMLEE